MTQQHPIAPSTELVEQWAHLPDDWAAAAALIAQWGADQELQACGEWLMLNGYGAVISRLRIDRRPKPPSLKERIKQAISSGDTGLAIKLLEDLDDTV